MVFKLTLFIAGGTTTADTGGEAFLLLFVRSAFATLTTGARIDRFRRSGTAMLNRRVLVFVDAVLFVFLGVFRLNTDRLKATQSQFTNMLFYEYFHVRRLHAQHTHIALLVR
jgi:hypothetical protein